MSYLEAMIKNHELRIGNFVYLFGQVTCLSKEHMIYLLSNQSTPEPIAITEERLIQAGFEIKYTLKEVSGAIHKRIMGDEIAKFELTYLAGNWWLDYIYGYYLGFIPIKYFHQLQNLFYDLTGEELALA